MSFYYLNCKNWGNFFVDFCWQSWYNLHIPYGIRQDENGNSKRLLYPGGYAITLKPYIVWRGGDAYGNWVYHIFISVITCNSNYTK